MPYSVQQFQQTPNPNALKCILDRPIPEPIRSFRSRADAVGDPLGESLMALPGVTSILISGGWLTVNKSPETPWPSVKKAVEDVLKRA